MTRTPARRFARLVVAASLPFAPLSGQAQGDRVLAAFLDKSTAAQNGILAQLRETLRATDPFAAVLLDCAAAADAHAAERTHRLPLHQGKKAPQSEKPDAVLPSFVRYVFGVGVVETVDAADVGKEPEAGSRKRREIAVRQSLMGLVPGADAALARLQQKLDTDTSADRFAAFLHSWRNGDESFYEALDRTAGTPASLFFFDAMLADFTSTVAKSDAGSEPAPTGLRAAHDALHDAFLAYRQYRGFREAVAYALVLPPNVPLPARLRRYDEAPSGSYSLRQQVVMVCEVLDGNVLELVDEIVGKSPPMQKPLWHSTHDPYPAWNELFARHVPKMVQAAGDTDTFLGRAQRKRADAASAIQRAIEALLTAAPKR